MRILIVGGIVFLAWRAWQRQQNLGIALPAPQLVPGINRYDCGPSPNQPGQVYAGSVSPDQTWYGPVMPASALYNGVAFLDPYRTVPLYNGAVIAQQPQQIFAGSQGPDQTSYGIYMPACARA